MAVDERQRHQLYNRAVEVLGEEEAEILMAHLPPGGYPNLATTQDILDLRQWMLAWKEQMERRLEDLEERTEEREAALELRLKSEIVGELKSFTLRTVLTTNITTAAVFAGIAFTAAGLG